MIDDESTPLPPITELSRHQRRVLGVMVEKGMTTPEYYPLTLKALAAGCSQKSNRDPVLEYDQDRVFDTVEELRELGLAAVVHTESGRTERFRHYMRKRFEFSEPQLAIVTELLLRGRQQLGELRSRASRMVPIDDQKALREELRGLQEMNAIQADGSLDRRGVEVDHNFYTEREGARMQQTAAAAPAESVRETAAPAAAAPVAVSNEAANQIASLEASLLEVRAEQRELRDSFDAMSLEFRQLSERFDDLRHDLGG